MSLIASDIYNVYNEQLNPLIHSESYVLKANRKLREGYYDEAIISVQTNIEILIRIIYREVLFDSGVSEVDIENKLEDKSFMSILKKELQKYIGGDMGCNQKRNSKLELVS